MAGNRSFKEYIARRFDNQIFNAIAAYADSFGREDFDQLGLQIYRLHQIGDFELSETTVLHTAIYDLPEMRIGFDIRVEAYFEVHEGDYHYDETEYAKQWFVLKCTGDLDKNLDDFTIHDIEIYDSRAQHDRPMYDSLVPVMYKKDYEARAQEFLEAHCQKAILNHTAIDPMDVAAAMKLTVKVRPITEDCSVFGQVYFRDCDTELFNEQTGRMEPVHIPARTILVDSRTYFLFNLGKVNNTIIHECVHWHFHHKAFELDRLCNESLCMIGCKVIGGPAGRRSDAVGIMESQANALTPRIQMPLADFKRMAALRIREYREKTGYTELIDIMEMVIDQLALDFGVSRLAAKIRMVEAGYREAVGTFQYVDDHYVKPHTFRAGRLRENQTFTIGAQDAAIQRVMNPELKTLTATGDYLFVDNHYVYNTPKYVQHSGEDGALELTPYALTHMDECCLVFDMRITSNVDEQYHTECYLNREPSNITFELTYHNGYENATPQRQVEYRKKEYEEAKAICLKMTDDPEQCMQLLLDWRGLTYTALADITKLSERTIRRTVSGETTPKPENGVLICLGMHLPPIISTKLLSVLRCPLDPVRNQTHMWLQEVLFLKYPEPLSAAKKYLEPYGITEMFTKISYF